ncbi:uncharacterized protein SPSK_03625 [Sporothrix schenckii 1099-18]|uniref:Uncharacterized protein n=1 Tax=Sporothrix schenckii 1099-18 TaxID=1397361 RepID=A0A0F2M3R3_SPOSC|nr:uncharacterized protein SPSK_03625 [Sporothrix schenckii 1099-18]KJR82801.1 hypothetical protein SPSK_03625 [Sporothrix schenckii 1099-18]
MIPVGGGLGSSASFCICLSTALLQQMRALAGPHPDQPAHEAEHQIKRINCWAFVGELCLHGEPSGVNNTVSSRGRAVRFCKHPTEPPSVAPLAHFPKLRLLLVDTKQPRSTAAQVDAVRQMKAVRGRPSSSPPWTPSASSPRRSGVKEDAVRGFERACVAEGFATYEAILGANGVGVLWPAVFGSGPDGKKGEEIDQERFESAVRARGIEELVGVGAREDRQGRKFWM